MDSWVAIDFETASARGTPCAVGLVEVEDGRTTRIHSWLIHPPVFQFWPFNVALHWNTPDGPRWIDRAHRPSDERPGFPHEKGKPGLSRERGVSVMQGHYKSAAICRRGHVQSRDVSFDPPPKHCPDCGAGVLTACPACSAHIRGPFENPTITVLGGGYDPPTFCHECGSPYPWLDRQGRIYLLENMLDGQELDPADELSVREELEALRNPELSDEEVKRRWTRVRNLAPGLWEQGKPILESVISAAIKSQMGL